MNHILFIALSIFTLSSCINDCGINNNRDPGGEPGIILNFEKADRSGAVDTTFKKMYVDGYDKEINYRRLPIDVSKDHLSYIFISENNQTDTLTIYYKINSDITPGCGMYFSTMIESVSPPTTFKNVTFSSQDIYIYF
jgi:hypothetical protein